MTTMNQIPESLLVNEAIRLYPETIAVFNDFGIDACCGGAVPIAEAALRDGADLNQLLAALAGVLEETP
jgi:regulator of cell morphogenesis and NO signaling